MSKIEKNTAPKMLSITRGLGTGHFMMFSGKADDSTAEPIIIRNEIAMGQKSTVGLKLEERVEAQPSRLESAELRPGHDALKLVGSVRISSLLHRLTACSSAEYRQRHEALMAEAIATGVAGELARRYAITLLSGLWGWRNSDSASSVTVAVAWHDGAEHVTVEAKDLLLSSTDAFSLAEYPEHTAAIERLAGAIEAAMCGSSRRAKLFEVSGVFAVGAGAPVYPSQEWADKKATNENGIGKVEEFNLSRVLAKMQLPDGTMQAFMTERKVGNQLRRIDTWYPDATAGQPIAVEAYGANVRENKCHRATKGDIFGLVTKVAKGEALDSNDLHYYTAMTMRGGVFSAEKTAA